MLLGLQMVFLHNFFKNIVFVLFHFMLECICIFCFYKKTGNKKKLLRIKPQCLNNFAIKLQLS